MTWDERRGRRRFVADELLQIALQALLELAPVEVARLDPEARLDRVDDAFPHQDDRRLDVRLGHAVGARDRAREPDVEALQRGMQDRAAQHAVDLLVDRRRAQVALDEPRGRAGRHPLELRDGERVPRQQAQGPLVRDPRRTVERAGRALEPPVPAVLPRQRGGFHRIGGGERGQRPQPLALGGRVLELPGQGGQRPSPRLVPDVVLVEELADRLPERPGLAR